MQRPLILAVLLGTLAMACSGGGGGSLTFTPISGNSEFVVGPNRIALALVDKDTAPILGGTDTAFSVSYAYCPTSASNPTPGPCQPKLDEAAQFVPTITGADGTIENGFWVTYPNFDQPGLWEGKAELTRDGKTGDVTFNLTVSADSTTPLIGQAAPPDDNPTLKTEPNIKKLSTDSEPDQAFYQMTVTEAIAAQKPFVVVFATPAFCTSRLCGPALDNVKAVRAQFADRVNFIHIEPYVLDVEGQLVPGPDGGPQTAPAFDAWRLNTEPWVFIVGADGKIVERFEGSASTDELTRAITQALG